MGKRSNFERREQDFYPTPESAVLPLLPHLAPNTLYAEPCAGDGALIDVLSNHGHICALASDFEPRRDGIEKRDALTTTLASIDCVITNPPWDQVVPILFHF